MKKKGYYSSGEFARMANVTLRTIRFYDKKNILKPSLVTEAGARFYTDEDFARLQQILLLKYLGFSLDDIREMTVANSDYRFMLNSLKIQKKLIQDRIEQMQLVEQAIEDTTEAIKKEHSLDWNHMLNLIHLTGMETSLKKQYQNASNIAARIHLHSLYTQNSIGWFGWIYKHCQIKDEMSILEVGCGDGTFWIENESSVPLKVKIILSDISEGMLRDARRALENRKLDYEFQIIDCQNIPYPDETFDLVLANHVLFYCDNIEVAIQEIFRILKPGGRLVCSTYGSKHMKEISGLVREFDERIVLSGSRLYERFGRENGREILNNCFRDPKWITYEDFLVVSESEPLISYILSCHGNQAKYIPERYREFLAFVNRKTSNGFKITKDAGIFICEK